MKPLSWSEPQLLTTTTTTTIIIIIIILSSGGKWKSHPVDSC